MGNRKLPSRKLEAPRGLPQAVGTGLETDAAGRLVLAYTWRRLSNGEYDIVRVLRVVR